MLKQQIQYSKPWTKDSMYWSIKFRYPTDSLAAICWQWSPPSWHINSHRNTHICWGKQSSTRIARGGSPHTQLRVYSLLESVKPNMLLTNAISSGWGGQTAAQQSQSEMVSPHILTLSITDVWKKMFYPHWHLYCFNWLPLINDPVTAWTMNNFIGTMLISRQFPKGNGLNYALQVPCLILISMATAFPVQCHSLQQSKMWGGMCHVAL